MSTKVRGRSEKWHQHILLAISICVALALIAGILAAAEFIARRMEPKVSGWIGHTPHDRLGWVPTPGRGQLETGEFKASFSINALHMNDREFEPATLRAKHRVLALGDSHTFAVGASTEETWPKQVETRLFADRQSGVVFNAGVIGYSVGQYLEMYRKHRQTLMPTTVLVGFSMATDLYDLIPPERGGFIYGGDASRVYFDLDGQGNLLEKQHDSTKMNEKTEHQRDASHGLRSFLGQFALFRTLKRSQLAMAVAMYYRPGGKSLWPGLDTALKINLSDDDAYRWLLAERILGRLADEAKRDGAQVLLVNIPYLAQVYDSVWASSFGRLPGTYDRMIASRRLAEMCARIGARFVDTTEDFIAVARERKRWLHWPQDAHPTPEGHRLIADVIERTVRKNEWLDAGVRNGK